MKTTQLLAQQGHGPCYTDEDPKCADACNEIIRRSFKVSGVPPAPLDLSVVMARVAKEHPDWDAQQRNEAERGYREFFLETQQTVGGRVPTPDVDEVWHWHILHLGKYIEDCLNHFGFILIHEPRPTGSQPCSSGDRCGDPPRW